MQIHIPHGKENAIGIVADISTSGIAFTLDQDVLEVGDSLKNAVLEFPDGTSINLDLEVKRVTQSNGYTYGTAFVDVDWPSFNSILTYIFSQEYPYLKALHEFSRDEVYDLYSVSGYMKLKAKDEMDRNFGKMLESLDKIKGKNQVCLDPVFFKDGKILSGASLIRIYGGTFLGQHLAAIPDARMLIKSKLDIYLAIVDFLANHPYCKNYLSYIVDISWHRKMFQSICDIINDKSKFLADSLQYFRCEVDTCGALEDNTYTCKELENVRGFLEFAKNTLEPIVVDCYEYNSGFYLNEIKRTYEVLDIHLNRKIWCVYEGEKPLAYAVIEVYPDGMNLFNVLDLCQLYPIGEDVDYAKVLLALLPKASTFFKKYSKQGFNLMFKADEETAQKVSIDGVKYQFAFGRIIASKEGILEYKRLINTTFK